MEEEILYCSPSLTVETKIQKRKQKRKLCIYEECKVLPCYNLEGKTKGLYCSTHKLDKMVNIISKSCIYENCKVIPSYNLEGNKKPSHCSTHKLEKMINVITKKCIYDNCKTRPSYNFEGESKGLYCSIHKLDKMMDVINKRCIYEGCKSQPSYNFEGENKKLYCSTHKLKDMVDVVNKTCIYEGCKTQPCYNFESESNTLYCFQHKLDKMVDIKNKRCIYEECKIRPYYNLEGESKALYCSTHKLNDMIDIKHKNCKTYLCNTRVKEKYDGYCLFCYINIFPDKPTTRNYKTKEYSVVEFVKTIFPNFDWIGDKKIVDGCSKRRPDLLLDLGYQIIIVEIDENQHIDYDCSCENKRIMELSQDLSHRPIIFIRFNPDNYNDNGINVTSCWGQNKNGLCVIKKSKKNEWTERLNTLERQISYWVNPENKTSKTVEIIQLFYDV